MTSATILNCDQRTPEWAAARLGRLTGTGSGCIWSGWSVKEGRKKGSESTQRRDLRIALAVERLTGESQEESFNLPSYMQRGIDQEQASFDAYELHVGRAVRRVGFISRDDLMVGCSPDGIVGDLEGGVEMKNPKTATHVGYIRDGQQFGAAWFPDDYIPQVRHNLYVTGAEWWDFVSFDSRLPEGLRLFVRRMTREQAGLEAYDAESRKFLAEVDAEGAALLALKSEVAA